MNLSDEGDCSQHVTMYFLGKQMGNKQETKDKNQPFLGVFVKIPLKQESHIKKKILDNRLITKDFFRVTSGIRTHDIQNHNLTL